MPRILVTILLTALVLPGVPARAEDKKAPPKPIVAVFRFTGALSETPADETLALFGQPSMSLLDLVRRMDKAADDDNVKAVVLVPEGGSVGIAQLAEVRQAMAKLHSAGKEVLVNTDSIGMGQYVLFSGATRLSVAPTADVWVSGLYSEQPYVRGLLDKISVKPDFLTCGAYKSAAEIFLREGPSPEADAMMNWLVDGVYETFVDQIAKGRNVTPEKVRAWIDGGPYSASKAKELGMIDAVEQREDFESMLRTKYGDDVVFEKKYGEPKQPTLDLSSPFGIFKFFGESMAASKAKAAAAAKDAVAVVYVVGPIQEGDGDSSNPFTGGDGAFSSKIRRALDEAAKDDAVKAVVLRVDSPGGSATASEIILDATRRVKAKKPFTVSMGDVAGSGGYYVSCASDLIFADEATITASIGVVGGKFATNEGWKRLGITFHPYQRGANAAILSSATVFSPSEREHMQKWMDEIYGVFKGHVTSSRGNRLKKPLDELAGGRVFTGKQALELGLVDRIGSLHDAIAYVADQASLKEYDVRVVPAPKNFIEKIIEESSGVDKDPRHVAMAIGLSRQPSILDLAMPFLQGLDPKRVALVRTALARMQLIQTEGVIVMMPEMAIGN